MNFTILAFRHNRFDQHGSRLIRQNAARTKVCASSQNSKPPDAAGTAERGFRPKDAGLYFSIVLRPTHRNTLFAAYDFDERGGGSRYLQDLFKLKADIKWANDIHVTEKKICGILAETAETPKGLAVVMGIGINLKIVEFSAEIDGNATSIEAETGKIADIDKF